MSIALHGCLMYVARGMAFALLALSAGCLASDVRPLCPGNDSGSYYFLATDRSWDETTQTDFVTSLRAMSEPSLSCASGEDANIYRFTWLGGLHHRPTTVRVVRLGQSVHLYAKVLGDADKLLMEIERTLSLADWQLLERALAQADFWRSVPSEARDVNIRDGSAWVFEGRKGKHFQLVERWSPSAGPFRELGRVFMRLAAWSAPF